MRISSKCLSHKGPEKAESSSQSKSCYCSPMVFSDFRIPTSRFKAQQHTKRHTNKPTWQDSPVFFQQGFRQKLLSISLKWRRNCWQTETVQYSWGHFHPWRDKGYWRPTESLHLSNSDSLPSRPRERRKFFSFEKLFLFTDGLLLWSPSKFSFWSTTTHTRTYKQANLAKLTCVFSTKLQAETFVFCPFRWI